MSQESIPINGRQLARIGFQNVPSVIAASGRGASWRFIEFFTANIRNKNTREAYAQAVSQFFHWCEARRVANLDQIRPVLIAAYIEELQNHHSTPTVKQHLAAVRMLFDWLVVGQVLPMNPASAVRGPKYVVKVGKTPVLTSAQARQLLDSIGTSSIVRLRDRAIVGFMCYTFARASATAAMKVGDYFESGKRWRFRLHEKGGKRHEMPAHHNAEAYIDEYVSASGIGDQVRSPLFRAVDRHGRITQRSMHRIDIWRMVKRRTKEAGLPASTTCHTMRATGITTYLDNDGTIENAQVMADHESPRTTKLYDRTSDEVSLDEVERIVI